MAKSFNVSFNINGNLDASLLSALRQAASAMRGLGNSARAASAAASASRAGLAGLAQSLNNIQNAAQKFRDLKLALRDTQNALSTTQGNTNSLAAQLNRDKRAAEELKQKLESLQAARRKALDDQSQARADAKNLRAQREALKAQARALGATASLKIPRELLGTAKGNQLSALLTQITAVQNQLKSARATYQEQQAALKNLQTQIKETGKAYSEASRAMSQSANEFNASKNKAAELKAQLQQQQAALHQLRTQLGAAGFKTQNFAASEARLVSEINRVNEALIRQQNLMNAQSRSAQASQEMFNAYNNFQNAVQTAEQIINPFEDAAKNAIDFEYAMSKVKALTQMRNIRSGNLAAVGEEMEALTKQAEHLGATTEFTATEVAQAMGYYGMAGWDTKRIQAAMQSTLDLATIAGDHNIPRTADVFSDAMTALGMKAGQSMKLSSGKIVEQSEYFTDAFAYAITQANLNREQLFEALKYNAPTSHAAGLSLGETLAMNMVSANAGIKGSMAGTAFRAGWTRFLAPPKTAQKALADMGMAASDASKEVAEAGAALASIGVSADSDLFTKITVAYKHYQTLGKEGQADFLTKLVGRNALSAWQNVFDKGNIEEVARIAQEIDSGAIEGWAKDTAAVMRDNTKTAIDLLTSSLDALQKSVGDALTPAIRAAAEEFAPMVTAAAEWVAANPGVVQACAAIVAALATLVVGAAAVKLAFAGWKFVATSIALVGEALGSLGSGALLGGLIGRLAALRTALFGLGGAATIGGWGAMFGAIGTQAAAAATAIRGFFASLTLGSIASGASAGITAVATALRGAAVAAMSFAFSPVGVALMALALAGLYCYQNWDKVAPVLRSIASIITGALAGAIATVKYALYSLKSNGSFDALISSASQLASIVGGALVKAFAVFLTVAASAIAVVIQLIADLVKTVIDFGGGLADALGKALDGDFSGAFDSLKSTASKTFNDIKNLGSHVWDGVKQGAKNVQQTLDMLDMAKLPTKAATARHAVQFDASGVAHEAPQVQAQAVPSPAEVPQIDTSATQAALDGLNSSAANATTGMDAINQATQQISQTGTDVQTLSTNAQTAGTQVQSLGTNSQTAAPQVQAVGNSAQTASPLVNALGITAGGAQGNVGLLGDTAGGSVGNILSMSDAAGQVASALAAKAVEISSIKISVPQVSVAAAPAAAAPAANYEGGIYRKGAFLTTFAEKSPEAAIPLDNSARAKNLWTQAGQILGMLPQTEPVEISRAPETKLPDGEKIPERSKIQPPQKYPQAGTRRSDRRSAYRQRQRVARAPELPRDIFTQTIPRTTNSGVTPENLLQILFPQIKIPTPQIKIPPLNPIGAPTFPEPVQPQRRSSVYAGKREKIQRQYPEGIPRDIGTQTIPRTTNSGVTPENLLQILFPKLEIPTPQIKIPPLNPIGAPTFPEQVKPQIIPQIFGGGLAGDRSDRIISPQIILPSPNQGGLFERIYQYQPQETASSPPTINLTVNVTINGRAGEDVQTQVRRGVEESLPVVENWSRQFAQFQHERRRRSLS